MSDMGVCYQRAAAADQGSVVALLRACSLPVEDLPAGLPDFFLAKVAAEVIGSVGLEIFGTCALLRSLAVGPTWRGRGISRGLWDRALPHAAASGVGELFLLTTTAEPMFARWGFQRASRDAAPPEVRATREFSTLCPGSAAFMRMAVPR